MAASSQDMESLGVGQRGVGAGVEVWSGLGRVAVEGGAGCELIDSGIIFELLFVLVAVVFGLQDLC